MVAAHRGAHMTVPENSLASIRAAAEIGVDFVELDIKDTKDGGLIAMHDDNVATSTNGTGKVSEMTIEQIRELTLNGATDDPETRQVPLFSEALALADELDVMIYLDAKTSAYQALVDEIREGPYYHVVLYRDDWNIARLVSLYDDQIMIMPPVPISNGDPVSDAKMMLTECPDLAIVEYAAGNADADVYAGLKALGLKIQQDVMVGGDILANWGDYSGYKTFIDAGTTLMQTDYPHILTPAVAQFNESGIFPVTGPTPDK